MKNYVKVNVYRFLNQPQFNITLSILWRLVALYIAMIAIVGCQSPNRSFIATALYVQVRQTKAEIINTHMVCPINHTEIYPSIHPSI